MAAVTMSRRRQAFLMAILAVCYIALAFTIAEIFHRHLVESEILRMRHGDADLKDTI